MVNVNIVERLYENSERVLSNKQKKLSELRTKMAYLDREYEGYKILKSQADNLKENVEKSGMKTSIYFYLAKLLKRAEQENWSLDEALKKIDNIFESN